MERSIRCIFRSGRSLTLFVSLISVLSMSAQVDRSKAPRPGKAPEVRIPEHRSFTLANGMRVIVVEDHRRPLVAVQVKFDIEPIRQGELAGFIDLTGELLGAGTTTRSKQQIDEQVDSLGAELFSSPDGVYASCLTRNLPALAEIVADVVLRPTFPEEEFEKARTRALSAVQSRKEDPDGIAREVANVLTYTKGHPYGDVVTETSLEKVMRKHVEGYYKRFFQPKDGYLVFVGDITEKQARDLANKLFGTWTGVPFAGNVDKSGREVVEGLGTVYRAEKKPQVAKMRNVTIVDRPNAPQSVVKVVFPLELHPADPMALSAAVMNTILGGGVFNARLMQNLREDKGYTYGAYSSLRSDRVIGAFSAGASVRTEVTDSAITELMFEIEHLRQSNVGREELELAKNYMAGSFARSLEDPRTVARFALNTFMYELPRDHYNTYLARLDTISADDVRVAAEKYLFPDNADILVVGDKESLAAKLTMLSFDQRLRQLNEDGDIYRESVQAAPDGMTVQMVMDAYFKALGGRAEVEKVRNVRMDMSGSMGGMPFTMTQWNVEPNKYAMEMRSNGTLLQRIATDGAQGVQEGPEGRTEVIEMDLEDMINEAAPFPELHYLDLGYMVKLAGVTRVNDQDAYKVMVLRDNGGAVIDHFSVETGLKLRREEQKASTVGNLKIVTDYKDYRAVNGIQFPHLIVQKGPMELNLVVNEVVVNGGVDPDVYKVDL
ncbi:MAG: insulinase family protein [Flavobacteriales bacterium]|nr:insulinase family protein [Flavobacteriales bacterium]